MATPTNDSYTMNTGSTGYFGITPVAPSPVQVVANGVWTWFNDPRARVRNGATYVGWINSGGDVGVTKFNNATNAPIAGFVLRSGMEIDDHDNAAIHFLNDGRVVCLYAKHNDTSGLRYRISTLGESVSAFESEQALAVTTPVTYANPHYLSQSNRTYVHYRSGQGGAGTNPMNVRSTSDWSTWDTERTWIQNTNTRPYVKSISNGSNRIDFVLTDMHPDQGGASVYHCYMQLDSGTHDERFYKSDGTLIGFGPITPAQCTLIYSGASVRAWVWDITYGSDGRPRVLFTRFPGTTDHRYMFSRWTGTAWTTPEQIAAAGGYLYAGEPYYSGGCCFDSLDANKVYLSVQNGAAWELHERSTADGGASWSAATNLTPGTTTKNCRPFSPRDRAGAGPRVVWWRGTYTDYVTYNTEIMGV